MTATRAKVINLAAARVTLDQRKRGMSQAAGHTLAHALAEFLMAKKAAGKSGRTVEFYSFTAGAFVEWATSGQVTTVTELTPAHVRAYLVYLRGADHTEGGIHTMFTGVRTFLNWYRTEYALADWHPLRNVEAPKARTEALDPLSLADFLAILDTCTPDTFLGDRDRAILLLLLDTGIRWEECSRLMIDDVDFETGRVLVRKGKGGKTRVVFVGEETGIALAVYLQYRIEVQKGDPLWVTGDGDQLSKAGIREVKRRAARAAGIPEPGMHAFRRAFAINALTAGMGMSHLQRLLGHADLTLIQRYAKLTDPDLADAHRRFGIVDRLGLG